MMDKDDVNLILSIGRLEGKLDALIQDTKNQSEKLNILDSKFDNQISKLSERVASLEKWKSWVIGVSAAIAAFISWLAHLLR